MISKGQTIKKACGTDDTIKDRTEKNLEQPFVLLKREIKLIFWKNQKNSTEITVNHGQKPSFPTKLGLYEVLLH